MPVRPYREKKVPFRPSSQSLHERINDPQRVTNINEVVADIIQEEIRIKTAKKRERLVPMVTDPCPDSPIAAHWWVYPAQGKHGQPWCRYCGEYK